MGNLGTRHSIRLARRGRAESSLVSAKLLCALLVVACKQGPAPAGPPVDAAALLEQIQKAHAEPQTLSASGKAAVDAPQNGGRYQIQLVLRRPASLRIAALDPLGNPAALLVADGGRFALLDLRSNVFYRGPSTPENLSRLIPQPLRDDELVSLLAGAVPELRGALPVEAHRAGDGFLLTLAAGNLTQEVSAGADLRITHVRRLRRGNLWWEVALDDFDDASGQEMPRHLRLSAPAEKIQVEVQLKERVWGKPTSPAAFQLAPPKGTKIEDVE
jgi:outer membrane biogenesis lipoprotein LolB